MGDDFEFRKLPKPAKPKRISEVKDYETAPDTRERSFVSPYDAIRAHCLDCVGYHPADVSTCEVYKCDLRPFRFGRSPFITQNLTDEQRAAKAARMQNQQRRISLKDICLGIFKETPRREEFVARCMAAGAARNTANDYWLQWSKLPPDA